MITGSPRNATITSQGKTELLLLNQQSFRDLLKGRPEVVAKLRTIAKARVAQIQAQH
jgi:CRP-like cAMP-binding protein